LYLDAATNQVKEAQHVAFDEHFSGVKDADCPPNVQLLHAHGNDDPAAAHVLAQAINLGTTSVSLNVDDTPFLHIDDHQLHFRPLASSPLGLTFTRCSRMLRAYVSDITQASTTLPLHSFRCRYLGSYIVAIDDCPIFSLDNITVVLQRLCTLAVPPSSINVSLAPERAELTSTPLNSPLHLRLDSLARITALNTVPGDGHSTAAYAQLLDACEATYSIDSVCTAVDSVHQTPIISSGPSFAVLSLLFLDGDPPPSICRLQTEQIIPKERQLKSFTRGRLKTLPNWSTWDAQFDAQLDAHHDAGTLNHPVPRPRSTTDNPVHILRLQWNNLVKDTGKRKCRACIDGSKRSAPGLRDLTTTYASCIETPCMRLFFALAAAEGLLVTFGDTTNAFQQSPPPSVPCFLEIDDANTSWYLKRFKTAVDPRTHVIPVECALQGHPEAGRLWEQMIVGILVNELGFHSTSHERNLYRGFIDGALVLLCRQVDDFAVASRSLATSLQLIALINKRVTTRDLGTGTLRPGGLHSKYNGLDVHQTADDTKLNCETYIGRVLQTHGWEAPTANTSDAPNLVPMTPESGSTLVGLTTGPLEGTTAHKALERTVGYSYRQLLGELTYAYVLCRPDLGYAVTLLSRFSTSPHHEHYIALKQICKYLRKTCTWGILYWRDSPLSGLPVVPLDQPTLDPDLGLFPLSPLLQLVGYVDAAHATDLGTRRSVTGYVFMLVGGAIAYKSKLQATCATSSTEAEFIAAVHAAKTAKYLRSVLSELGYLPLVPTVLHIGNQAAVAMINDRRPTVRARHIDIQHFAIQEWRARGDLVVSFLPGILNTTDQATKALAFQLHGRHARRAMGHFGPCHR